MPHDPRNSRRPDVDRTIPEVGLAEVAQLLMRFEGAWQQGEQPAIDDYLQLEGPAQRALLVELVHADLYHRLAAGEVVRIERYLERYQELRERPDVMVDLAAAEYDLRRQTDGCNSAEYLQRFPAHEAALRERLGVARQLEPTSVYDVLEVSPSETDLTSGVAHPDDGPKPHATIPSAPTFVAPSDTDLGDGVSLIPDPYASVPATHLSSGDISSQVEFPAGRGPSAWPSLPGYEILGELGRGSMGVVYKARQMKLDRVVALKLILPGSTTDLSRIAREARVIARLQHPNIVQIYEIGEHNGRPFLALEFCPGGSLAAAIKEKILPPRRAAEIVEGMARAMEAAHQNRIIHRDLKPANVLLTANGQPKITDFGLAKKLDEVGKTMPGVIMGTPCYMPPEQAAGETKEMGPVSDTYSLCATLYELLTGRPPFMASSALATLSQVLNLDPVPPRGHQPTVPRDLETICLKGLMKDRSRRYATAQDLADDLRRFLDGEPILARRVPIWERTWKWARRERAQAALVFVALLAGLAGIAGAGLYGLYLAEKATTESQKAALAQKELESKSQKAALAEKEAESAKQQADLARKEQLLAEQKLDAEKKAADTDRKIATLRDEARLAEAQQQFNLAAEKYSGALAALDPEAEKRAPKLRQELTLAVERVREWVREKNKRQQLLEKLQRFPDRRDHVLALETDPFVGDRSANTERIRQLAAKALAEFDLTADTPPERARQLLKPYQKWIEKAQDAERLASGCYELLLIWAEAEASGLDGKPVAEREPRVRRALRLLEIARALGAEHKLPDPRACHLQKARYLTLLNEDQKAQAEKDEAARIQPTTALDYYLDALAAYRKGDTAKALAACAETLKKQEDHLEALYLQAVCQFRLGQMPQAERGLALYLGRRPSSFVARFLLASASGLRGAYTDAESDFTRALELVKDLPGWYLVLTNRAAVRFRQERLDDAEADLRLATLLQPDAPEAYINLAEVYSARKQWAEAVAAATDALDRKPRPDRLAGLYRRRGRAWKELGDRVRARVDLQEAITRAEADPQASKNKKDLASDHVELGNLLQEDTEYRDALAEYSRALEAFPDFALAHLQTARCCLTLRKKAENPAEVRRRDVQARDALQDYLRKGGAATAEIYKTLGFLHHELQELPLALSAYSQALYLDEDVEAFRYRGWIYLQLRSPRNALGDFRAALKRQPGDVNLLCGQGRAHAGLDRPAEAIRGAEQALAAGRPTAPVLFQAACIHAEVAVYLARPGAGRAPGGLQADQCREQAVVLLLRALKEMPEGQRPAFWRKLRDDPALHGIRDHPSIRRLEESFGSSAPEGRKLLP
jgi:tetratricopeptide (TPR) repeat protein/tRNA A-37 threonylcarbamoyl transferase component Bud32